MRNKKKLLPNSYPGVYELKCIRNSAYFGETKKQILASTIEHQHLLGKMGQFWSNILTFHRQFHWIQAKAIARENDSRK